MNAAESALFIHEKGNKRQGISVGQQGFQRVMGTGNSSINFLAIFIIYCKGYYVLNWDGGLELNPPYQVYLGVFYYIASDGLLTPKEIHSYISYIFQEERSEAVQTKRGRFL